MVPPIPTKEIQELIPKYMNKRKEKLQIFLNEILNHPLLCKVEFTRFFLTINDTKILSKTIQQLIKQICPKKLEDITTIYGIAKVGLPNSIEEAVNSTFLANKTMCNRFNA